MPNESVPYSQTITAEWLETEDKAVNSKNHGLIQTRLARFINGLEDYIVKIFRKKVQA